MTINKKKNTFLAKVDEINPGSIEDLKVLKTELNNQLRKISTARLYHRIYTTLKKDSAAIQVNRDNQLLTRQLVIAIKKVDGLITENRNTMLLQQSKQKERLSKGKK